MCRSRFVGVWVSGLWVGSLVEMYYSSGRIVGGLACGWIRCVCGCVWPRGS